MLARVEGEQLVSRCRLRLSDGSAAPDLRESFDSRPVSLRAYADVHCRPRQVAWQDSVVLPDTFRHNTGPRPRNQQLVDLGPLFVRPPTPATTQLDGVYFHLDNQFRGHFGHALTEQVSRLWGWPEASRRFPGLKALVFDREGFPVADWELELFEGAGIPRADLHVAREPAQVETLVCATPMFSMPDALHPAIALTYERVGEALAARASDREWPDRVFCSRRRRRSCRNAPEVEQRFSDAGFSVVYPEELPLPDQIMLVRQAGVIAGFAGSGMFQIAFAGAPKHVILVSSESYTATNEYMFCSVLGHRLDLVLCRPDVPRGTRWTPESYHSAYTYDPSREGRFLDKVLDELK